MGVRVGEHFFVSYSAVDGADFVLSLADRLAAGPPSYRLWVDRRELRAGDDWDEQLVEAIRVCRGLLFVMTADSVRAGSVCKDEWVRALKYKKPVIPLGWTRGRSCRSGCGSRQFIDFSDLDAGVARLREYLAWASTPEGVLSELLVPAGPMRSGSCRGPIRRGGRRSIWRSRNWTGGSPPSRMRSLTR